MKQLLQNKSRFVPILIATVVALGGIFAYVSQASSGDNALTTEDNLTSGVNKVDPQPTDLGDLAQVEKEELAADNQPTTEVDPTAEDAAADAEFAALEKKSDAELASKRLDYNALRKAARVVHLARDQVGKREWGDNCNPYGPCHQEWCGHFVYWIWFHSGLQANRSSFKYQPYIKRWAKRRHVWKTRNPRRGDIAVFRGHMGIVTDVSRGNIRIISGNHGNAVRRSGWFRPSRGFANFGHVQGYLSVAATSRLPLPHL